MLTQTEKDELDRLVLIVEYLSDILYAHGFTRADAKDIICARLMGLGR